MKEDNESAMHEDTHRKSIVLLEGDIEHSLAQELEDRMRRERAFAGPRLVWSSRTFLLKVLALGLALSFLVSLIFPSHYQSTAKLMPPDDASGAGSMLSLLAGKVGGSLGALGSDILKSKTPAELFVGVLRSRTVEDDLITKFDLRKVYGKKLWEEAREKLEDRTEIETDRKSEIITLKVKDRNAKRAAAMTEEYIEEMNRVLALVDTSAAHRERVFLENRLQQVNSDLEAAEKDFSQYSSKNATVDIREQGKAMVDAAADVEGQLIAAETQLQGLKQIYTDNNVRVRTVAARVDELRRQLQNLSGKTGPETPNPDAFGPSIRQLPLLGVNYADLLRRTMVQQAVFETLTQQYELAKVEEAKELPVVKVLDSPDIPEKAYPTHLTITLIGSGAFLVMGVVWVLGKSHWNDVDPHDPKKIFVNEIVGDVRADLARIHYHGPGLRPSAGWAWKSEPSKTPESDVPGASRSES